MRVLFYNWVSFDDEKGRGGGVTVYLKNLIKYIDAYKSECEKDLEITFLSSGSCYDIYDKSIRYEKMEGCTLCDNYTIVNSPVFSPAYLSFFGIDTVLQDNTLKDVFVDFMKEKGPFDIVHFHNLEGLSLKVLESKILFPNTKFIYTMHNYYAFCPQVNLWQKENNCCLKENTDEDCMECMRCHVPQKKLEHKMAMNYTLQKKPSESLRRAYAECGKRMDACYKEEEFGELREEDKGRIQAALKVYRDSFVQYINTYMDMVLGVSQRVCDIAVKMHIDEKKIRVSYIGTKAAERAEHGSNNVCYEEGISLVYLGYRRLDKGYFFLLDVLEGLKKEVAEKLSVTIAAKSLPDYPDRKINTDIFKQFTLLDGYTKDNLEEILQGEHLGIVPVLWEDNLPQVAIEMVAYGVPILTSDRGGAWELGNNEKFRFEAGNVTECREKIEYFVENPKEIQSFWDKAMELITMKSHVEELIKIYSEA